MAEPIVNPTAQPDTQPQAVNVDMDAIVTQASAKATEAAEKKMQAVFKSMLQQEGLDADQIKSAMADWSAKNKPTEPQEPAKQPDNSEEYKKLLERMEALEATSNKAQAELTEKKQFEFLAGLKDGDIKIPADQLDYFHFRVSQRVTDGKTFEDVATQYFKENPPYIRPPEYANGPGKPMATATEAEKFKADYDAAVKNKDRSEMSRITRLAQSKGVSLY